MAATCEMLKQNTHYETFETNSIWNRKKKGVFARKFLTNQEHVSEREVTLTSV